MEVEKKIVDYIFQTTFDDLQPEPVNTVKKMVLADIGATIAGSNAEGCKDLADYYRDQGGKEEATIFIHGGKIPAHNAAFVNSVMSRALDFCDAIAPGPHIGSSAIPSSLACTELIGGCSGKDLITALVLGTEVAARLNLTELAYDGFDPTGICVIFASTVVACKILKLNTQQIGNALGLALNRCGGSFQSHIDGSLGVRVNQGWVSHAGVSSARFSQIGITGPKNFLTGVYGYLHLYGKDMFLPEDIIEGLGQEYNLEKIVFKKFPSCALTASPTETILHIAEKNSIDHRDISAIKVMVPPYAHKLVGHEFEIGDNPTVNAQFSIQYCVANALLRKGSKIQHFELSSVRDPEILEIISKISVQADSALDHRGHTALDMWVETYDGREFYKKVNIAPGFPGNPLTEEDHQKRFRDCINFGNKPISKKNSDEILSFITNLEEIRDVRRLVHLLNRP